MFEPPIVDSLDPQACADQLDALVVWERRVGAERLALAAHWADLHPVVDPVKAQVSYGADGTPAVAEFAAEEVACVLRMTTASAAGLLRDALDLRHRHPRLWSAVMTGQVEEWKARKVARATASALLTLEQAQWVDVQAVAAMVGLPFGRAMTVVEAKIIAVDPDKHEQLRLMAAERRYVSIGRDANQFGLRTLVAQTTAGEVLRFDAMVQHLAGLLAEAGDTDPLTVRRAKALGLLANPALACVLLAQTPTTEQTECPDPADADPADPAESGDLSAVELGAWFGRLLTGMGTKALDRLRPRSVLYLHLAQEAVAGIPGTEVVRTEELGPIGVEQLREWLATDQVIVRPVLDPVGVPAIDEYAVRGDLREALVLLHPVETFPYGTLASRKADADHPIPYLDPDEGGPPGQTGLHNLGPLSRRHHRAKTFGGFALHEPLPGMYLWRTPTGHWYQVDNQGTHALGRATPVILEQMARIDLAA